MQSAHVFQPELLWTDAGWRRHWQVEIDADGWITRVGPPQAPGTALSPGHTPANHGAAPVAGGGALQSHAPRLRPMPNRALLPGFVNAHSHAFQRALRGFGETYPEGAGDFWTWREAMYSLVEQISPQEFERVCRWTFREMLAAGFTSVGEFHYLHHVDAEVRDFGLDEILLRAAHEAGIRMVLLACYYRTGGVGKPLGPAQKRFDGVSVETFLKHVERLAAQLDPRTQRIGIAPHSIRAVPSDDLRLLVHEARRRDWVCHMHVEEQPREKEECAAALGATPMRYLLDGGLVGPRFTAVHCTHTTRRELAEFVGSGGRVCACPITESSLGDGISEIGALPGLRTSDLAPLPACIGTDSNIRLDPFEELRWLEGAQRLKHGRRGILAAQDGRVDTRLLGCGTSAGGSALGLAAGAIAVGQLGDLVSIDLTHRAIEGWSEETLLPALLFGAGCEVVSETCVGGQWHAPRR